MILNFVLDGQTLSKGKGFPDVVEKSANFLKMVVDGIPEGYTTTAYFELSWEQGSTYDRAMSNGRCVVDEYVTTLPKNTSEYVDYFISVSIAGTNSAGDRFTTNKVNIKVNETAYSDETQTPPEIPKSQYDQYVAAIASYSTHPPIIGENENWYTWNGVEYEDSGVSSNNKEILGDISTALDTILAMQSAIIGGDV